MVSARWLVHKSLNQLVHVNRRHLSFQIGKSALAVLHLPRINRTDASFSIRLEYLPDKGASMQKELRDLRQEIGVAESQLRLSQNQARTSYSALPMAKNPSSSSLTSGGSKHAVLLNELPGKNNAFSATFLFLALGS